MFVLCSEDDASRCPRFSTISGPPTPRSRSAHGDREHSEHSGRVPKCPLGMTNGADKGRGVSASPLDILRNTFGFPDFRGVQEQVIGRVMAGAAHAGGDADRRGQVALLSGAGAGAAGHGARDLAADRADARPDPRGGSLRAPRRVADLRRRQSRARRSSGSKRASSNCSTSRRSGRRDRAFAS